jgi:hypothetical protein
MSQAITAGTLSESDARILSARYVRAKAGLPCAGGKLNQRLEIPDTDEDFFTTQIRPAVRILTPEQQRAETADIETVRKPLIERETWIAMGFCALGVIALLLAYFEVPFLLGQLAGSLH